MNPDLVRCAICGWVVLGGQVSDAAYPETPWANQFRALLHTPDGLLLTGVGIHEGLGSGGFYAPFDKDMRWDDAGFEPSDDNAFAALPYPDFRGRHGIVFHDACWSLLVAALQPAPISLQRLYDVCSSLPVPGKCRAPTWGHDWGGAVVLDDNVHFPWEDRYEVPEMRTLRDPNFGKNPYQVPGVDRLLAEEPQQPPGAVQVASARPPRALTLDCFRALPRELCAAIATLLPTTDMLRARLASRAFWPVFHNQQFWASRFTPLLPAADRSWLFETRRIPSARDWRWLYRRTNDINLSPGLRNRRRVWGFIQQIVDILALVWNELPASLPEVWSLDSARQTAEHCVEVNGLLWRPAEPGDNSFHCGCRLFRTQGIAILADLTCLSVYTAAFGDGLYVVGMSLHTAAGEKICLGYSSSSSHSVELNQLWGFRVAMSSRGLQALQCVTGPEGSASSWFGSTDDVSRTERLVVNDRIVGLEVGFDGCKIVRLTVRTRSLPSRHLGRLRDLALWYPSIPPDSLCLNEGSFPPRDFYLVGFKPLFWCHFGGPCGKYLRHLTGIEAVSSVGVLRIRFFFNAEVPWVHRSFGRVKVDDEYEKTTNFSIDGPGGERFETIKMRHYYSTPDPGGPETPQEGYMIRCELYTNRGRSCCILGLKRKGPYVRTKVTAAPGTVITGLYGTEAPEGDDDISAMGVITEEVGGDDDG